MTPSSRLVRKIVQLPELIELMADSLAVHHLPHYAQELATAFHWFYQQCRVISSVDGEKELTRARLRLCQAARVAAGALPCADGCGRARTGCDAGRQGHAFRGVSGEE